MSASQFASFAAYTPPPDELDNAVASSQSSNGKSRLANVGFPSEHSYQSGGVPTFSSLGATASPNSYVQDVSVNQWQTRYGWRVDFTAAGAYMLGPLSALLLLILETQNDYIRFHAYQSALLTTPAILFRIFISPFQFPSWLVTPFTLIIIILQVFLAFHAYRGASGDILVFYHIPFAGRLAEKWLDQE